MFPRKIPMFSLPLAIRHSNRIGAFLSSVLLATACAVSAQAVQAAPKRTPAAAPANPAANKNPQVEFRTSQGNFVVELYPAAAPKTVTNFLQYVKSGHYNGTIFHRVISNFMIQGGGYDAKFAEKATRTPIENEARQAQKAGLKNTTGMLAMARTNAPHSATAQFFINVQDNAFLDPTPIPDGDPVARFNYQGHSYSNVPRAQLLNHPALAGYAVFGKVISGMDVVQKIRNIPTGSGGPFPSDVPKTTVTILSATQIK